MGIEENVKRIKEYLAAVSEERGEEIKLVGATKTRTEEEIIRAIDAGLTAVGENRPQELRDKLPFLSGRAEIHLIGPLQKNKIKYVVGKADLIHSCDSVDLARAVNDHAAKCGLVQDVLLEVDACADGTKHGFSEGELFLRQEELKNLDNVRFRGLMAVLPKTETGKTEAACMRMRELFERGKEVFGENFSVLSMGMSDDFKIAVKCGSNMVRLGRAIFGERR